MPRRTLPSLRTLLAVTFGAVALLAAASTALLGGTEAARRITVREVAGMDALARQFAAVLDQGMARHLDLMRAAASLPAFRDATATQAGRRAVLQVLQQTFPDFARLALLAPDGRPLADTSAGTPDSIAIAPGLLAGGRDGPAISDVHDLPAPPGTASQRVIDLAWPVRSDTGALTGILVAVLSWDWVQGVASSFDAALRNTGPVELIVQSRSGAVLLGPAVPPDGAFPGEPGLRVWPDGRVYVVGSADTGTSTTEARGVAPDLGWRVIVRQPAATALAPVRELKRHVALAGSAVALVAGVLGWLLARAIARPGEILAAAARATASGEFPQFRADPSSTWYAEAREVAAALRELVAGLRRTALRQSLAETALRDLNQTLETRVADRTAALEAANLRLAAAQRLETVGKLTGGVAHDINNLLQVIESGLAMLPAADAARRRAVEASMAKAVDRGARLTRQLLAFARQQSLAPAPLDLARHLAETADLLAQSLRGDIELRIEVAPGTWPVMVDRTQLEVALLNLAVNARDAMATGGSLRIRACNCHLPDPPDAPDGLEGEFVRIAITDTGAGMTQEVLSRAFEPFFTTKDASRGSGLGLSQVWGFARQSGGAARIDSAAGAGSTITLVLPRAETPAVDDDGGPTVAPSRKGARMVSVLLVEDDIDVADMLADVLDSLGHSVRHVPTGAAALVALQTGPRPDLVITDMMMPGGLSGLALARELRDSMPGLPVILATGYSERAAEFRASGLPVLRKPFRAAELEEAIRQAMEGTGPS